MRKRCAEPIIGVYRNHGFCQVVLLRLAQGLVVYWPMMAGVLYWSNGCGCLEAGIVVLRGKSVVSEQRSEQYGKKLWPGQINVSVTPFPGNFFRIRLFWNRNFFPGPGLESRLMPQIDSSTENTLWFFRLPIDIREFRLSTTSLRCGPIEQKDYFVSLISQLHSSLP